MGMDVFGKNPKSETGRYFRANVWWWRPLAEISLHFAPEVCSACKHWGSNDGDGLDADGAHRLAETLEEAIEKGLVGGYIEEREKVLASLPDGPCFICKGTGIRSDRIGVEDGWPTMVVTAEALKLSRFADNPGSHPRFGQTGSCNGCHGAGREPHPATHYHTDMETVKEWVAFLKNSGGFEIC